MSFRLVRELAATGTPVVVACRVLRVSISGYYEWRDRPPSERAVADKTLSTQIVEIHALSRGTYGVPRVHAELRLGRAVRCGRKRVARLMREATQVLLHTDFVRSAQALGAGPFRVMLVHILPNLTTPIIVATSLAVGEIILLESVLSFLGLGVAPPLASWGNMLTGAQETLALAPLAAFYPGLLIFATVMACNLLGDGLQAALDPRAVEGKAGSNYPETFKPRVAGRSKQRLGDALGLKNFGVNRTTLKPGAASALRRSSGVSADCAAAGSAPGAALTNSAPERSAQTRSWSIAPARKVSPAATSTDGFEVLVQEVIAAITTAPSETLPCVFGVAASTSRKFFFTSGRLMRSCGRFGPAMEGLIVLRSSASDLV